MIPLMSKIVQFMEAKNRIVVAKGGGRGKEGVTNRQYKILIMQVE